MPITSSRTSVTDVVTQVSLPGLGRIPSHTSVLVKNTGANAVNLGGSDVSTANGYSLAVGAEVALALKPGDQLWGVCAALETATVNVLAST